MDVTTPDRQQRVGELHLGGIVLLDGRVDLVDAVVCCGGPAVGVGVALEPAASSAFLGDEAPMPVDLLV